MTRDVTQINFYKTSKEIQIFIQDELGLECEIIKKWDTEFVVIKGLPKKIEMDLEGECKFYGSNNNHYVAFHARNNNSNSLESISVPCVSWDDIKYHVNSWLKRMGVNCQTALF